MLHHASLTATATDTTTTTTTTTYMHASRSHTHTHAHTQGKVRPVKVLGILCMIDEGEADWKVVAIDSEDPWYE